MRTRKAFTLMEVILAMSVSVLIMFGCCSLMFDMISITERLNKSWSLKDHADGVEKFLRARLMNSTIVVPLEAGDIFLANASNTVFLTKHPEATAGEDYNITFGIQNPHPLFEAPLGVSSEKLCYLVFNEDGLSIDWKFSTGEYKDTQAVVYKTRISPWVKELYYIYPEDNLGWKEMDRIDTSSTKMPQFIKIVFEKDYEHIERIIPMYSIIDYQISK